MSSFRLPCCDESKVKKNLQILVYFSNYLQSALICSDGNMFADKSKSIYFNWSNQGFESRCMSVELICYVKSIIVFFYKFYNFFCRRYSLMNRPCHNNLFQFMQHDNFRNLNRVIFIYWKHLECRANAFWYLLSVIKRYAFPYFMKSVPIPKTGLFWNIAIVWYMPLSKFSDTVL